LQQCRPFGTCPVTGVQRAGRRRTPDGYRLGNGPGERLRRPSHPPELRGGQNAHEHRRIVSRPPLSPDGFGGGFGAIRERARESSPHRERERERERERGGSCHVRRAPDSVWYRATSGADARVVDRPLSTTIRDVAALLPALPMIRTSRSLRNACSLLCIVLIVCF
jgi:hypothetical protein